MQVIFVYKDGFRKKCSEWEASILEQMGRGKIDRGGTKQSVPNMVTKKAEAPKPEVKPEVLSEFAKPVEPEPIELEPVKVEPVKRGRKPKA